MPRNGTGTFSLVSGNPVVSGTTIEATWANNTLNDIATAMTDSLSRSGQGGMTAALRVADGSQSAPGVAFANETGTGIYRAGTADARLAVTGSLVQKWTTSGAAITGALSATGDVGVGTATPVFGSGSGLEIERAGVATLRLENSAASNSFELYADSAANGINLRGRDSSPLVFWTANTEKARLDASGNLGIGTSSPTRNLSVQGASFVGSAFNGIGVQDPSAERLRLGYNDGTPESGLVAAQISANATVLQIVSRDISTGQITFHTGSGVGERARITSGGDLLVGTTTNSGAGGITLFNNSGPGFSLVNNNNAAATGYVFSSFRRSSTEIGSITQNGTTAVLFNTTSDRRLKNNITQAPSASDVIDAIEIVSHDWKAAPDEHVAYGVIAQDLALVAPQAVLQGDDGEEVEKTWGVDYSKLVPMLIKEIQSLRARVAALESQP